MTLTVLFWELYMTDTKRKTVVASGGSPKKREGTMLWLILSIVFGIAGGGIAWFVLRKKKRSAGIMYLAIGSAITVFSGAGILLASLLTERSDEPLYTYDQVLSAARQMSPECYIEET
jgi:hypothetical protein